MTEKYEGLSVGAAFELIEADEQFELDAQNANNNAAEFIKKQNVVFREHLEKFEHS